MPTTAASITECSLLVVIRAELPVVTMTVSPFPAPTKSTATCAVPVG